MTWRPSKLEAFLALALAGLLGLLVASSIADHRRVAEAVKATTIPAPVVLQPAAPQKAAAPQVVTRTITRYVLPPQQKQDVEQQFHLAPGTLGGRETGNRDLLADVKVPSLPSGGTALVTQDAAGKTEVEVVANKPGFWQLGGIRETGLSWDPLNKQVQAYHQQDLLRTGKVVWGLRAFAGGGYGTRQANYGAELRAGWRW